MSLETLSQLRSGQLEGTSKLTIAADLTEFPREIFDLADTLEVLDLSRNRLRSLPDDFDRLQKLKILFISQNEFEIFPSVLGRCSQLSMVGFKANRIRVIPEDALPPLLRWLILTDNALEALPLAIGQCDRLQKLMLAGNQLQTLPETLQACRNLELVRLAANRFETLPDWLWTLPKLSWIGLGNSLSHGLENTSLARVTSGHLVDVSWDALEMSDRLGEGASGIISRAVWQQDSGPLHLAQSTQNQSTQNQSTQNQSTQNHDTNSRIQVAVKIFKGAVTSDGLPEDEMRACLAAGLHENLVGVLGRVVNHPDRQLGLVLPLLDSGFEILGGPPSFESCTRDTFADDRTFSLAVILRIAQGIASVAAHLHDRGILHGDLYAHNILVNASGDAVLSDFGAASFYPIGAPWEYLEVRAFGCLLEDLLDRGPSMEAGSNLNTQDPTLAQDLKTLQQLNALKMACFQEHLTDRPRFQEICQQLNTIA